MFTKFVTVYLLVFMSYLSWRFSQLEPDHLHAQTQLWLALGVILIIIAKGLNNSKSSDDEIDGDDS